VARSEERFAFGCDRLLTGEFDIAECEPLKAALARAAIRAVNVIVDLSQCAFVDCAVIGLLLHAQTVVARDGKHFGIALPSEPNAVIRAADLVHLSARGVDLCLSHPCSSLVAAGGVCCDSPATPLAMCG
jgi:anti-anti-sigma factor